ncbi:MAG: protein-export chaperone SecB [Dysgonamonadaceae bacterium]|nr:protein-export chaperone SecB [Dysgonamonadaceae bacterium]
MDKQVESIFKFVDYKVNHIQFDMNKNYVNQEIEIELEFEINSKISFEDKTSIVSIKADIFNPENKQGIEYPFHLAVIIEGIFSSIEDPDITEEDFNKFSMYNAPAAMFPFLRSCIADITKASNFPPIILPLINITNLIDK